MANELIENARNRISAAKEELATIQEAAGRLEAAGALKPETKQKLAEANMQVRQFDLAFQ